MRLDKGLEAGALLVQGILAGLTLASLYAVLLEDSFESFIAAYEVQIPTTVNLQSCPLVSLSTPKTFLHAGSIPHIRDMVFVSFMMGTEPRS